MGFLQFNVAVAPVTMVHFDPMYSIMDCTGNINNHTKLQIQNPISSIVGELFYNKINDFILMSSANSPVTGVSLKYDYV